MGIKVRGDYGVKKKLENISKRSSKGALREMRKGGKQIEELAKKMAPIDEGNLEEAITYEEDRSGINNRIAIKIFVDEDKVVTAKKNVGDYALIVHDNLDGKNYGKGEKSKEKAKREGVEVGPFFMDRAVEELKDEIADAVERAVKRAIK